MNHVLTSSRFLGRVKLKCFIFINRQAQILLKFLLLKQLQVKLLTLNQLTICLSLFMIIVLQENHLLE